MRKLVIESLTPEAFAPFGTVLQNDGSARRNFYPDATRMGVGSGELKFWISHVEPTQGASLRIAQLERHPFAPQTFVPLKVSRWIVIVAPNSASDAPDCPGLRAFLAAPGQGLSYHRGTWHYGTTVLDHPAQFGVLMWRRSGADDDEFADLDKPVELAIA